MPLPCPVLLQAVSPPSGGGMAKAKKMTMNQKQRKAYNSMRKEKGRKAAAAPWSPAAQNWKAPCVSRDKTIRLRDPGKDVLFPIDFGKWFRKIIVHCTSAKMHNLVCGFCVVVHTKRRGTIKQPRFGQPFILETEEGLTQKNGRERSPTEPAPHHTTTDFPIDDFI